MAHDCTTEKLSLERARILCDAPETATAREIARSMQELIDLRTAVATISDAAAEDAQEIASLNAQVSK